MVWIIVWNGSPYRRYDDHAEAEADAYRLKRWASTGDRIVVVEQIPGSGRRHAA